MNSFPDVLPSLGLLHVFANISNGVSLFAKESYPLTSESTIEATTSADTPPFPSSSLSPSRLLALLTTLAVYGLVFGFHVRFTAPVYTKFQQRGRQKTIANINFGLHITSAVTEVIRWQIRACWEAEPKPDNWDLLLPLVQIFTSLRIAKYIRRGLPIMTRPTFQGGAVLRLILAILAWCTGSGSLHKSEVAALDGFIYTRLALIFLGPLMIKKDGDKSRPPDVYNLAIYTAAIIAIAEVDIPHAPKIYSAFVVLIAWLNRWVSSEMKLEQRGPLKNTLLNLCVTCGFAEVETISQFASHSTTETGVDVWIGDVTPAQEQDKVGDSNSTGAESGQLLHIKGLENW